MALERDRLHCNMNYYGPGRVPRVISTLELLVSSPPARSWDVFLSGPPFCLLETLGRWMGVRAPWLASRGLVLQDGPLPVRPGAWGRSSPRGLILPGPADFSTSHPSPTDRAAESGAGGPVLGLPGRPACQMSGRQKVLEEPGGLSRRCSCRPASPGQASWGSGWVAGGEPQGRLPPCGVPSHPPLHSSPQHWEFWGPIWL